MPGFEEAFADAERAVDTALAEAQRHVKALKALKRAAHDGNILAMRKASTALKTASDTVIQATGNALAAWRFSEEQELAHLSGPYSEELVTLAEREGLKMRQEGARLLSYPSVLRVQPADRSLKIDRKAVRTLRPSRIIEQLKARQAKPPRSKGAQLLESLYEAYQSLTRNNQNPNEVQVPGAVVLLAEIFRLFKIAPGSEYSREEFARDLHLLKNSGPHETKNGFQVEYPAGAGLRGAASNVFQTINEHGSNIEFYGLRFRATRS